MTAKKSPVKILIICWSLMVIYLPGTWTFAYEITVSPPSRCKETQIKVLSLSCYLRDESGGNDFENPLGQKKKDNLSTLTYPVSSTTYSVT